MVDLVFETERLLVRRWQDSDLSDLRAVYGDADTMRWVDDGKPITEDECLRWLEVGFCGIVHPSDQKEAEVKYATNAPWPIRTSRSTVYANKASFYALDII